VPGQRDQAGAHEERAVDVIVARIRNGGDALSVAEVRVDDRLDPGGLQDRKEPRMHRALREEERPVAGSRGADPIVQGLFVEAKLLSQLVRLQERSVGVVRRRIQGIDDIRAVGPLQLLEGAGQDRLELMQQVVGDVHGDTDAHGAGEDQQVAVDIASFFGAPAEIVLGRHRLHHPHVRACRLQVGGEIPERFVGVKRQDHVNALRHIHLLP